MKMKDEKEVNTEYQDFENGIQSSMGDQRTAEEKKEDINVDKEILEARSRNKYFDAQRDYYSRGEDKEYNSYTTKRDQERQQDNNEQDQDKEQKQDPHERLGEVDKLMIVENDRDKMKDLIAERLELSEQISNDKDNGKGQEQENEREME